LPRKFNDDSSRYNDDTDYDGNDKWLVGGIPTPLKNMTSSVGMMIIPNIWKVIKFHGSKPPTSIYIWYRNESLFSPRW
jgi:hypothetical protein